MELKKKEDGVRHRSTFCPGCRASLDTSARVGKPPAMPRPGDVTVCAYCARVLQYDGNLALVGMSKAEVEGLEPETQAVLAEVVRALGGPRVWDGTQGIYVREV